MAGKAATGASSRKKPAKTKRSTAKGGVSRPSPERVASILALLAEQYPSAETALNWQNPLQLLAATILSAQCTDVRVNKVTPDLFRAFPSAADLGAAPIEELERLVHSTGFYRNKAKALKGMGAALAADHGGEVPREMAALVKLPGVARKTANVVLGSAFGLAVGVVVDTHVKRLAGRLGLTAQTAPNRVEQDLMFVLPEERWIDTAHQLILHGRAVCKARKPDCAGCVLKPHCPTGQAEDEEDTA